MTVQEEVEALGALLPEHGIVAAYDPGVKGVYVQTGQELTYAESILIGKTIVTIAVTEWARRFPDQRQAMADWFVRWTHDLLQNVLGGQTGERGRGDGDGADGRA